MVGRPMLSALAFVVLLVGARWVTLPRFLFAVTFTVLGRENVSAPRPVAATQSVQNTPNIKRIKNLFISVKSMLAKI